MSQVETPHPEFPDPEFPAPAFNLQTVRLADTQLPYVECGAGEPIVLLHGALGDWRTWRQVLQPLSASGRVIAYTQRWFGARPREHGKAAFGADQQAGDLLALLDALRLEAAHVAAWSFSAHSALAAALRAPGRIKSLVLYDLGFPTFVEDAELLARISEQAEPAFRGLSAALARGDPAAGARALIDASAGEGRFDAASSDHRNIWIDNAHTLALLFGQTPPTPVSARDLAGLQIPVTIAWGERSGPYRLVSRAAARLIPSARGVEIAGADHLWPQTAPDAFAGLCRLSLATGAA